MGLRRPEIIKKELGDLRAVIKIHEDLLRKFPNDKVIKLSLEQYLFREKELLKELELALIKERRSVVKSTFKDKSSSGMEAFLIGEYLLAFQKLASRIAKHMHVEPLNIYLTEVFAGSFGIVLSSAGDNDLFFSRTEVLKKTLDYLDQIRQGNIKELFSQIKEDRKLKKVIKRFLRCMNEINSDLEIEWKTEKESRRLSIPKEIFWEAYKEITQLEEEETEIREIIGTVKGVSLLRKEIEIVPSEEDKKKDWLKKKRSLRVKYLEELEEKVKKSLDKTFRFKIEVRERINETIDEIKEDYKVVEIY